MKKIKLMLVEDDPLVAGLAIKIIRQAFPYLTILGPATSQKEALMQMELQHPQLLLLDIEVTDGNAFDLLRKAPQYPTSIIFMSAYQEYALEAISLTGMDFILKPFDFNDLIGAIEKALEDLSEESNALQLNTLFHNLRQQGNPLLFLTTAHEKLSLPLSQIHWAQAIPGGCIFKTGNKLHKINRPLRRYEIILSNHSFYRCHPHFLVNAQHILKMDAPRSMLQIRNGDVIPFEPRKLNVLNELMGNTIKKPLSSIGRLLTSKLS